MATLPQQYLFNWQDVDAASDLDRLLLVLKAIPDEKLMLQLEADRANGRDEYPVRATWNSILAGVVYQHPSIASLRRELSRNAELRKACGFDPRLGQAAVPTDSAYSNLLSNILNREPMIREMFHVLVEKLKVHLLDLGRFMAHDGKELPSLAKGPKKDGTGKTDQEPKSGSPSDQSSAGGADQQGPADKTATPATAESQEHEEDRRSESDATWGVKTYRGKRKDETSWEKVVRWFGFELHLLVDSEHEMPINYKVTTASAPETTELLPMLQETKDLHPEVVASCEELSADRGYDSEKNITGLWEEHIRAIIDKRADWDKSGDKTRPLFPDRVDNVVYGVKGDVQCVCPATGETRPMTYGGFEKDRQTLKYRCPAAANGFVCAGRAECPRGQTAYGKVVRIKIEENPRMFTPLPRDCKSWDTAYDRRTAVERVNSRIDQVFGFERHTIRGLKKMEARVGIALVVLLAMAVGRIEAGQREQMRSLVAPVPDNAVRQEQAVAA
jgi:hypothetical protein